MKNGIYVKRVAEQFFLVQHYESKETFNGYPLTVSDQLMSQGYQTIDGVKAYAKRLGFTIQGQIVQGKVVPLPKKKATTNNKTTKK